ncbi:hypothetical protein VTK56DRAFT_2023 [Thermocarpiscus australiensis]
MHKPEVVPAEEAAQPERVQLHPEGDAILAIDSPTSDARKEFLVSSAVLSTASDYFRTLFRSDFKEGIETRRGDCPTIVLKEDDPDAMEIIPSLLHFRAPEAYDRLDPRMITKVALQSDKYDCSRALRPWSSQWFRNASGVSDASELGLLLGAAYFLRASERFGDVSARLVRQSPANLESFWASHDILPLLPQTIKDKLTERVSQILEQLHQELQSVEALLRRNERVYEIPLLLTPNSLGKTCENNSSSNTRSRGNQPNITIPTPASIPALYRQFVTPPAKTHGLQHTKTLTAIHTISVPFRRTRIELPYKSTKERTDWFPAPRGPGSADEKLQVIVTMSTGPPY